MERRAEAPQAKKRAPSTPQLGQAEDRRKGFGAEGHPNCVKAPWEHGSKAYPGCIRDQDASQQSFSTT